jgi:Tfp pilus assembly protein PilP
MTSTLKALILALFLAVIFLASGCGNGSSNSNDSANSNAAQANSNSTKTNVEELGMLINVPYESEEVFWRDDPQHKKIVAVLRFSQSEANKLIADAEKVHPPQKVSVNPESWFPPELVAQSDTSGDDTLSGRSFAANAFFQEPYNDGRIVKVDDSDYFILELNAK